MAKKGSKKKKKKSKPIKSLVKKVEARLLGYWNKQAWEEFITLYERQKSKAEKSAAASLWNPAVYNLMLKAAFKEQSFPWIEQICAGFRHSNDISHENLQCLQVLETLLEVYKGNAHPGIADNLPDDPPGPFADLSSGLREVLSQKAPSPLSGYVSGKQKKARKGEKHFARLASMAREFNALRDNNFNPSSVKPLTRIRKDIQEAMVSLHDNQGISSQVLTDMEILADLMRSFYLKPNSMNQSSTIIARLKARRFRPSDHPAVISMGRAFLILGSSRFGREWEKGLRMVLVDYLPALGLTLPEHIRKQFNVLEDIHKKNVPSVIIIKSMLDYDVWTPRERMILLQAQMTVYADLDNIMEDMLEILSAKSAMFELHAIAKSLLSEICSVLNDFLTLYQQFDPQNSSILVQTIENWYEAVYPFPFFALSETLESLINKVCALQAPDHILLPMLHKLAEIKPYLSRLDCIARIKKNRAPLKLTTADLEKASLFYINIDSIEHVFTVWKEFLSPENYKTLVQKYLNRAYRETFTEEEGLDLFPGHSEFSWFNIPDELMEDFARTLDSDFPLMGLMLLTLHTESLLMPANENEAMGFLQNLPPGNILNELLFDMFQWEFTPYSNIFLARIIEAHAEYLTRHSQWFQLSLSIRENRLKILAQMVWEIWEKNMKLGSLKINEDIHDAMNCLRPLVKKAPKKTGRQKKSAARKKTKMPSLLDYLPDNKE